jgi:hypothetical protein
LSLYGGTALTFIHSKEMLRLSIDMDLNYRHKDTGDWGSVSYTLGYLVGSMVLDTVLVERWELALYSIVVICYVLKKIT